MSENRGDYLTRFESAGVGTKSKQAPISVMLPAEIDAIVRSLPNRSEWLRRVIVAAANQELQPAVEVVDPATEVDPAPTPTKKRRSFSD